MSSSHAAAPQVTIRVDLTRPSCHVRRVQSFPRGRVPKPRWGRGRRRRNRPPETLRYRGPRRELDLWKAGSPVLPHRRSKATPRSMGRPNLSGSRTEGGHACRRVAGGGPLAWEPCVAEPVLNIEKDAPEELRTTPLDMLHRSLGAKMVPFAGYSMPVQYGPGVMAEHLHCRAKAALFDVSHMGQFSLRGPRAAEALETMVPGDYQALKPGRQRYTLLLNEAGGIIDDLMIANYGDRFVVVANASRKELDKHHMAERLPPEMTLEQYPERALLALQGRAAADVMSGLCPAAVA